MSAEQKNPTRKALYIAISSVFAGVVILLLAASCTLSWCWKNRDTNETKRAARKAASIQLREAKPEPVLATLKRLVDEKSRQNDNYESVQNILPHRILLWSVPSNALLRARSVEGVGEPLARSL